MLNRHNSLILYELQCLLPSTALGLGGPAECGQDQTRHLRRFDGVFHPHISRKRVSADKGEVLEKVKPKQSCQHVHAHACFAEGGAIKELGLSLRSNPEEDSRELTAQTRSTDATMNSALATLLICSLFCFYAQGTVIHRFWP